MILREHNLDAVVPHCYGVVIVDVFRGQSQEICNLLKRKINDVLFPIFVTHI